MEIRDSEELSRLINRAYQVLGPQWFATTRNRRALALLRWLRQENHATTVTTVQLVSALNTVYFEEVQLVDVYIRVALVIDAANRAHLSAAK